MRVLGNQQLATGGEGLDAPDQVHVGTDRGVFRAAQRTDIAHDHAPRMNSDTHLELGAALGDETSIDLRHRELHGKSARDGFLGMILAGHRRAKDYQDAVTDDLVDGALVTTDDIHHRLEVKTNHLDPLLSHWA